MFSGLLNVLLTVEVVPLPLLVHHLHLFILLSDETNRLLHWAFQLILLNLHQLKGLVKKRDNFWEFSQIGGPSPPFGNFDQFSPIFFGKLKNVG